MSRPPLFLRVAAVVSAVVLIAGLVKYQVDAKSPPETGDLDIPSRDSYPMASPKFKRFDLLYEHLRAEAGSSDIESDSAQPEPLATIPLHAPSTKSGIPLIAPNESKAFSRPTAEIESLPARKPMMGSTKRKVPLIDIPVPSTVPPTASDAKSPQRTVMPGSKSFAPLIKLPPRERPPAPPSSKAIQSKGK